MYQHNLPTTPPPVLGGIDNKHRDANWKAVAEEFKSERDALRGDVRRMQEERDAALTDLFAVRAQRDAFREWIRTHSGDTCYYNILHEICQGCRCKRNPTAQLLSEAD